MNISGMDIVEETKMVTNMKVYVFVALLSRVLMMVVMCIRLTKIISHPPTGANPPSEVAHARVRRLERVERDERDERDQGSISTFTTKFHFANPDNLESQMEIPQLHPVPLSSAFIQ